ncbi:hypothetical protein DSC_11880 [Pseudoxanthomonas spadix BD-a59]|uniref:Uncharacterized protein n=1 Tax=Pseudoxanthomonas spadix (strain BD-a59) TaxID=1045855 RepID=G7UQL7_PSEUP|nr:hypothetical protein DSC_11880 [Pseudoxanthomonas spadix BD-a59]
MESPKFRHFNTHRNYTILNYDGTLFLSDWRDVATKDSRMGSVSAELRHEHYFEPSALGN